MQDLKKFHDSRSLRKTVYCLSNISPDFKRWDLDMLMSLSHFSMWNHEWKFYSICIPISSSQNLGESYLKWNKQPKKYFCVFTWTVSLWILSDFHPCSSKLQAKGNMRTKKLIIYCNYKWLDIPRYGESPFTHLSFLNEMGYNTYLSFLIENDTENWHLIFF